MYVGIDKEKNELNLKYTDKFKSKKRGELIGKIIVLVILTIGAVFIMFPLLWMISTALKSDKELFINTSFIPRDWVWENFPKAWKSAPFTIYLKNTVFITIMGVIGALISNSLVAYGFAKINFKGKKVLFAIVLATMMIPGTVTMIPTYILYSRLKWVGTFLPLVVPPFFAGAFNVFLLRQFLLGIPNDYSEAAKIEGANEFMIYWKIILPLCKPALTAIAIFEFNGKWNDFMGPLLYLTDEKMYTLQMGLRTFQGQNGMEWQLFMAASLIVLLPVIIIFFTLQNYFIEGVSMSGIKG
ncbi:carbohydrate ABC transporter membrane protein 2, CUT1 family [Clostridium sp. USBA 49]|uniref:carbohydrate ABC transporter permease n=1 Tax=Clostridium sp. USBA 49 TaxID=1881060 RepID=UPI00099A686A|nr:carbohydrate ABC transporter permease [Clostridium sp. USBA 49]SKA85316.1 carbohydrate ABC transporter membrane protein 2, CUT1 family [Clostridium sp. USBA 49]